MTLHGMLVVAALIASGVALLSCTRRWLAGIAVLSCAVQAMLYFNVVQIHAGLFSINAALAICEATAGVVMWAGAKQKSLTTAATILSMAGGMQVVSMFVR